MSKYEEKAAEIMDDLHLCTREPDAQASGHFRYWPVINGKGRIAAAMEETVAAEKERAANMVEHYMDGADDSVTGNTMRRIVSEIAEAIRKP